MTTRTAYVAGKGDGVPWLRSEMTRAITKRVERLGRLNDLHERYLAGGDRMGLLRLAEEYASLGRYGCPRIAEAIRKEAMEL